MTPNEVFTLAALALMGVLLLLMRSLPLGIYKKTASDLGLDYKLEISTMGRVMIGEFEGFQVGVRPAMGAVHETCLYWVELEHLDLLEFELVATNYMTQVDEDDLYELETDHPQCTVGREAFDKRFRVAGPAAAAIQDYLTQPGVEAALLKLREESPRIRLTPERLVLRDQNIEPRRIRRVLAALTDCANRL